MVDSEVLEFSRALRAEIADRLSSGVAEGRPPYSQTGFTAYVLEGLADTGVVDGGYQVCYPEGVWSRAPVTVDGYFLGDGPGAGQLDLYVAIYRDEDEPAPLRRDAITKAIAGARRLLEAALGRYHAKLEPADEAYEMVKGIFDRSKVIKRVRIIVLSNGIVAARKAADEAEDVEGRPVSVEVFDLPRLCRALGGSGARDAINIDLRAKFGITIPCLQLPRTVKEPDYEAYLAMIPGQVLCDLYNEYGARLLELNVRSFLSVRGKINSGIRRSLASEPDRFLAYNNGIVATVDEIVVEREKGQLVVVSMSGLQIVNGGQTTASIHNAGKNDRVDLSSVRVAAKIAVIQEDHRDVMVRDISKYANSQNTIQTADFSANDPFHVEIEKLANGIWCPDGRTKWFYERARGQYQVAKTRQGKTAAKLREFNERTPPTRKFTKPELAKFLQSWEQKPHLVSMGAQKNFDHFMQNLRERRGAEWRPDEQYYKDLVAMAIVFRSVQKIVRGEKYPAHQSNIITYTMACLAARTGGKLDLRVIWQNQRLSDELSNMVKLWSHKIDERLRETAQGKMVTEWAKKEACWNQISTMELPLPKVLPKELAQYTHAARRDGPENGDKTLPLDAVDYENIRVCRLVEATDWLKISGWGRKSGGLQGFQVGIARTLAGEASGGWEKGPSPKQAKQGVKILEIAKENGILP